MTNTEEEKKKKKSVRINDLGTHFVAHFCLVLHMMIVDSSASV
jgi:hypothetical protein